MALHTRWPITTDTSRLISRRIVGVMIWGTGAVGVRRACVRQLVVAGGLLSSNLRAGVLLRVIHWLVRGSNGR